MRVGNTTEREAPWKLEFRTDRFKLPKWKRPYLVWFHVLLKTLSWCVLAIGVPGLKYIEKGEGYLVDNNRAEVNALIFTFLALLDFFITKNVLGPKLTGLHHGLKRDEEGAISYHYYAEKDFLSRYPAVDRDSFFTFFIVFSFLWSVTVLGTIINLNKFWIPFAVLGFTSVYLNLYLFVQVRYFKQWGMSKFFSAWLYNFFVRIENVDDDSSESNFRNSYYTNRVRY